MEILTDHHLAPKVVDIVANAREFVVLVTAYLRNWTHLDHALRGAVQRGVRVHLVIRGADGTRRERDKRKAEVKSLTDMGVVVHELDRLHAKAYLNEAEGIITSFNLVSGSHDSIEIGVRIADSAFVTECLERFEEHCPDLKEARDPSATGKKKVHRKARSTSQSGHCIGCGDDTLPFDPKKPLCMKCYKASNRGTKLDTLDDRRCHGCGKHHAASLEKPLCYPCFKRLPVEEREALA